MFQNVRGILEELQILLAPDKEHKKTFPKVPILGFRNGKSLKDYVVRGGLPKMVILRVLKHVGRVLVKCVTK